MKYLLELGADVNAVELNSFTALQVAAEFNYLEVLKLLLATPGLDIQAVNRHGVCALRYAAERENHEVLELLIAAGADVNAEIDIEFKEGEVGKGSSALSHSVIMKRYEVVQILVNAGAIIRVRDGNQVDVLGKARLQELIDAGIITPMAAAPVSDLPEQNDSPLIEPTPNYVGTAVGLGGGVVKYFYVMDHPLMGGSIIKHSHAFMEDGNLVIRELSSQDDQTVGKFKNIK